MTINCNSVSIAKNFFGLGNLKIFEEFGYKHLEILMQKMKQKIKYADLGMTDLKTYFGINHNSLAEFKNKKIAKLTICDKVFTHPENNGINTHTIGLVLNEKPNQHFYKEANEIIILDSLAGLSPEIDRIHKKLIDGFLKKSFPDAKITINKKTQQTDGSLTCLNWTFANLEVAKENLGTTTILNKLPKATDIDSIMLKQKNLVTL